MSGATARSVTRNAPTALMERLGHGKGYRYAHDEQDAYAAGERYFPDEMSDVIFYRPTDRGIEGRIAERLAELKDRDRSVHGSDEKRPGVENSGR